MAGGWNRWPRNLTDPVDGFLRTARQLIHDRDPLYTRVFGEILTSGDVGPIRRPPKSPNLNAYAERFVGRSKRSASIVSSRSARGICASSSTSTSSITIVRETTRDSTTSSCNDRHLRYARTPTCSGVSASAACSVSTIERPHEWSAH